MNNNLKQSLQLKEFLRSFCEVFADKSPNFSWKDECRWLIPYFLAWKGLVGTFNKDNAPSPNILCFANSRWHLYCVGAVSRSHGVTPRSRSGQVNALCYLHGVNSRSCHSFCEITHFAFEENFSLSFHHVADVTKSSPFRYNTRFSISR